MIRRDKSLADKNVGVRPIPRETLDAYKASVEGKSKHDPTGRLEPVES